MKACMIYDNRETTGLCVIQEVRGNESGLTLIDAYWVMFHIPEDGNNWYPCGKFKTYEKALKRMELIENEEIKPW